MGKEREVDISEGPASFKSDYLFQDNSPLKRSNFISNLISMTSKSPDNRSNNKEISPTDVDLSNSSITMATINHINNNNNIPISGKRPLNSRQLSFSGTSSPWFRRNSFLLTAMIENENFSVYDPPTFFSESVPYNIISLKESQGFVFNQDLFATPYQQMRALAMEKRYRAASFHSTSKPIFGSHGVKIEREKARSHSSNCKLGRRHTSYLASRPNFFETTVDSDSLLVIEDDADDVNNNDINEEDEDMSRSRYSTKDGDSAETGDHEMDYRDKSESVLEEKHNNENHNHDDDSFIFENNHEESDGDDYNEDELEDEAEEDDEVLEDREYGGDSLNRRYKVSVTEIVINENDDSFYPT